MTSGRSVLPLVPFGNVYWFVIALNNQNVVIDPNENYIKQTYRNRFEITTSQGIRFLSVSVESQKGIKTPLNEIKLFKDDYWKSQHLKTIESVYNSSPFYLYYQDELIELYEKSYASLQEFSLASLHMIIDCLEIDIEVNLADNYIEIKEPDIEYRNIFKPSVLKKTVDHKSFPEYIQVYGEKTGFIPNLSILDVLFNLGPETEEYLSNLSKLVKI